MSDQDSVNALAAQFAAHEEKTHKRMSEMEGALKTMGDMNGSLSGQVGDLTAANADLKAQVDSLSEKLAGVSSVVSGIDLTALQVLADKMAAEDAPAPETPPPPTQDASQG